MYTCWGPRRWGWRVLSIQKAGIHPSYQCVVLTSQGAHHHSANTSIAADQAPIACFCLRAHVVQSAGQAVQLPMAHGQRAGCTHRSVATRQWLLTYRAMGLLWSMYWPRSRHVQAVWIASIAEQQLMAADYGRIGKVACRAHNLCGPSMQLFRHCHS